MEIDAHLQLACGNSDYTLTSVDGELYLRCLQWRGLLNLFRQRYRLRKILSDLAGWCDRIGRPGAGTIHLYIKSRRLGRLVFSPSGAVFRMR